MAKTANQNQKTQWAAQFLAASELVRRGYLVSFTMGNSTPLADLMVGYQSSGIQFWVDVKGNSAQRGWFCREKPSFPRLYYILVGVGMHRENDRFFILSQDKLNELIRQDLARHPLQKPGWDGVIWKDALPFENAWNTLPREAN
jgi:hypothetical protein